MTAAHRRRDHHDDGGDAPRAWPASSFTPPADRPQRRATPPAGLPLLEDVRPRYVPMPRVPRYGLGVTPQQPPASPAGSVVPSPRRPVDDVAALTDPPTVILPLPETAWPDTADSSGGGSTPVGREIGERLAAVHATVRVHRDGIADALVHARADLKAARRVSDQRVAAAEVEALEFAQGALEGIALVLDGQV